MGKPLHLPFIHPSTDRWRSRISIHPPTHPSTQTALCTTYSSPWTCRSARPKPPPRTVRTSHPPTHLPATQFTDLPTYLPTYLPIYLSTYLPTYLPTYLSTYLPTQPPTYLPTGTFQVISGGGEKEETTGSLLAFTHPPTHPPIHLPIYRHVSSDFVGGWRRRKRRGVCWHSLQDL